MKQIVAVLCLLAVLSMSMQMVKSKITKDIKQTCMNETKTTEEDFKDFRKIGAPRSRPVLCYVACVYSKFDVWTADNRMNMTNFKKVYDRVKIYSPETYDLLIELIEKCNVQVKPDRDVCIAVNQTLNCLQKEEAKKFKTIVTLDIYRNCMNQSGNTEDDYDTYRRSSGAIRTRGLLCYIACIYKQFDVFTPDNKINVENFKKLYGRLKVTNSVKYNKIIKYINVCNTEAKRDPDVCIAVNQTMNCIVEEEAKVGTNAILE